MGNNISENIEEYLEVLYRNGSNKEQVSTTQLSRDLGIAPGSVTQMLKKLEKLEYIDYIPYKGASLTDSGMAIAQKITRKHRILEKFLHDVLKIKYENIHEQACEMEHTLSDEAERALCLMLKHPDLCPDDHLIPACNFNFKSCLDCFNEQDFDNVLKRDINLLALSELHGDAEGVVCFIRGNNNILDAVDELGITIGSIIRYKSNEEEHETYVFSVLDREVDIPQNLANNIFVKL